VEYTLCQRICPLKEVLGDQKPENPASAANDASIKDKTAN